jgi:mono/diheme cytochrome c family protein
MSAGRLRQLTLIAPLALIAPAAALAQNATGKPGEHILSTGFKFAEQSGEALYVNVCQACHMPDGKGAIGAGAYPALAGDANLAVGASPVAVVINGQRGMPPVGFLMSDEQVAAVVNYVRTHFSNTYRDTVSAADVKALRSGKP